MKRIILAVLMAVIVTTPCIAQEVEPDGIFTLEGTLWKVCRIGITINNKLKSEFYPLQCNTMGFYQGTVYWCDENECFSTVMSYINSPVVSIAYEIQFAYFYDLYIMQPTTGTGFTYQLYRGKSCTASFGCSPFFDYLIGIMLKMDDDWTPYDQIILCNNNNGCPEGMVCVDDPSDGCDPTLGDENCDRVCVNE